MSLLSPAPEARSAPATTPQAAAAGWFDRPEPALAVLAFLPAEPTRLAGSLIRPGPALLLLEALPDPRMWLYPGGGPATVELQPAELERRRRDRAAALDAASGAGFGVEGVELLDGDRLFARLGELGDRPALVVTTTGRAGRVRDLSRAGGAPVLAVPAAGRCEGRTVVVPSADAEICIVPVVRSAAAARLLVVGPSHVGSHRAQRFAERFGVRTDIAADASPGDAVDLARERDALLAMRDPGGLRSPRLLREALRRDCPVLLVPGRSTR